MTEYFDEVDQNDQILGQITRAEAHKHNIMHRAVHIFIQNESDLWLLQRRSSNKDLDPLKWTTSCSGHVDAGESYAQAALRECREELGIKITESDLKEIFRCNPCRETGMEFVRVYISEKKFEEFSPDICEISTIDFYTIPALIEKCKNEKETFSGSFLHLFQLIASRLETYSNDS
jgi:isopentenyl-diphosphate delta-isomerase type 1